jgi:CheY-like chemotaxis protein
VVSDPRILRRLVNNLLTNALRHSGATRVLVGAHPRSVDGKLGFALEIVDNGAGLPHEELARVNSGQMLRDTLEHRPRRPGSTGLGLYNVQQYVKSLGGTLIVESRSDRGDGSPHGTRFSARFAGPVMWRAHGAVLARALDASLKGRTIAILDDNQYLLDGMALAFESMGARVISSTSDLSFLVQVTLESRCPDLFVLDFMIGDKYVDETLKILHQRFAGSPMRAVIVTGHASHPKVRELGQHIPILEKPLTAAALNALVEVASDVRELASLAHIG